MYLVPVRPFCWFVRFNAMDEGKSGDLIHGGEVSDVSGSELITWRRVVGSCRNGAAKIAAGADWSS